MTLWRDITGQKLLRKTLNHYEKNKKDCRNKTIGEELKLYKKFLSFKQQSFSATILMEGVLLLEHSNFWKPFYWLR